MALLEIAGVSQSYGPLKALDGVDLQVEAGTFHGLIGPNGSGKSTLLKAIAGAHFATTGSIRFEGATSPACRPICASRAGLSLKFQITAVLTELSVYDNVLLALQSEESYAALSAQPLPLPARRPGDARAGTLPAGRPRRTTWPAS